MAAAKKPGAKPGRPTKLTPALQKKFVEYLRLGVSTRLCCDAVGITHTCFYEWMKQAATLDDDDPIAQFSDAVKKARGERTAFWLGRLHQGGANWQRFGWLLERCEPEDYRKREHVEVASDPDSPMGVIVYLPKEDPE